MSRGRTWAVSSTLLPATRVEGPMMETPVIWVLGATVTFWVRTLPTIPRPLTWTAFTVTEEPA